ncbi:MAG TPA: POTRA domain-containing protein [Candidatus Acidoferrales bacterium]|nr:POTRA domain-containing protein [Candidatus Acidoferrales bacterium]
MRKPWCPRAFCSFASAAVPIAALAFASFVASPAGAQQVPVEGKPVAQVRVVDESGRAVSEPIPPLPLGPGHVFDFAQERASLRKLYAMGDFSDIRVAAVSEPTGLSVDFIVKRNYYNNVIQIEGLQEPPTEPAALAALRLNLGEPFRESALREAIGRLEDTLHSEGLYLAKVSWLLGPHEDTRQMNIYITVDPGPRAKLGIFAIDNQTPYSDLELLKRSKLSPKNEMTSARLTRASQRLKSYLVGQGYLGGAAVITPGTYDVKENRIPLMMSVVAGPRVRVEISGARISGGQRRKLLPIYAEGAVDDDLLQEGRRNIRDYLERAGYFNADVDVTTRQDKDKNGREERVISYEVSRGDKFRLVGVGFTGNSYFNNELLARRLQLQPASFQSSGHFSQQLLRDDVDSIRALYLSNGFRDVQVTSDINDNYRGKKNNLFVTFHMVEGTQSRVADLKFDGNQALSTADLLAVTGSTPSQPFSEAAVASDRNNILAMYYNDGFPEARFDEEIMPASKPDQFDLVYHITEGQRIEVSKVLLTGYQYTRPGIIRREVAIKPAGPLRESEVVDTQRRLYNLGVFNRVQIAPQNPNGADPQKTVVVDTEEGHRYTIGYGGGFEVQTLAGGSTNPNGTIIGASPRGIFEIARSNMFGRAQTLSFRVRASTLQYRAALSYAANNLLNNHSLSLQLTGFADKTQDINTFTSVRYEGSLQLIEKVSPSSSLLYRYFYRRVEVSEIANTINAEEIPLLSQPTLVSGFGVTYARDRRDNPSDAKHGNFNTIDLSIASTALASSADFFRGSFQNSTFTSFGRDFVFARSVRFGVEQTYGDTTEGIPTTCSAAATSNLDQSIVPLPERFFGGGGTSIRGFGLNQAGPRDPCTGFPIGGLALLAFNQELHFPTKFSIAGSRIGGALFYDGGNVYRDINHISLSWKSSSLTDLSYFSHTVGIGLRYPTPVGPVTLDFGYQLNPAQYQATNAQTNITQIFRLPHFQFSFNIGPVF